MLDQQRLMLHTNNKGNTLLKCLFCLFFSALIALLMEIIVSNYSSLKDLILYRSSLNGLSISMARFFAYLLFVSISAFLLLGDERIFHKILKWRYIIALGIFIILVLSKISMSSIGYWDIIFQRNTSSEQSTLVGKARAVRSDEWLVQTSYCLSQANNDKFYPEINLNIRPDGQNMMISPGLVFDITVIGRPNFWGYYLFGKEYGFSWSWCFPVVLLFLMSFELSLYLTNNNARLSILAAFWITFSPPVQWWMQGVTGIIHPIVWMQALLVSALYFLRSKSTWRKILFSVFILISLLAFIINFYPSWQIPLLYLSIIFLVSIVRTEIKKVHLVKLDIALITGILMIVGSIIIWFCTKTGDVIHTIKQTVYPGERFFCGGNYPTFLVLKDIVSVKLPYQDAVTPLLKNQSAASAFLCFLPFVVLSPLFLMAKKLHHRGLMIGLYGYLLFQLSWILFPFPSWLANITLFSYVSAERLMIPMGLTATYLGLMLANALQTETKLSKLATACITCATVLCYAWAVFHSEMLQYLHIYIAVVAIMVFGLITFFLCTGKSKWFSLFMMALILITGINVNPVIHGLGAIYDKDISRKIDIINKADPGKSWIGLDNNYYGPYLVMNGIKTINGVHYYPDNNFWTKFDTEGKYREQYNRYAHVIIKLTQGNTTFESPKSDVLIAFLETDELIKTDALYLLSKTNLAAYNTPHTKFVQLYYNVNDDVYIYKIQYIPK